MQKPNTTKERDVLIECKALLDFLRCKDLLDYWRITCGGIIRQGSFLVPNKEMAGFSDIIILTKAPAVIFLELKAEKGRQSPNQKQFQSRVEMMGHKYYLCKSRSELCEILRSNGIRMELFIR